MNDNERRHSILRVAVSADIAAPSRDIYRLIADYRAGHPRIVPKDYFRNLRVAHGGYGDGTIITYDMIVFGRTYHLRALVTEPDPGRALIETDLDRDAATTFIVESLGPRRSRVTIATAIQSRSGVPGLFERALMGRFLRHVFAAELRCIDRETRGHRAPARSVTLPGMAIRWPDRRVRR